VKGSQQDREKAKEKVRKDLIPEAERIAKQTAEKWQAIAF
jgi:hypothetical protein